MKIKEKKLKCYQDMEKAQFKLMFLRKRIKNFYTYLNIKLLFEKLFFENSIYLFLNLNNSSCFFN